MKRTWGWIALSVGMVIALSACGCGDAGDISGDTDDGGAAALENQIEAVVVDVINDVDAHAEPEGDWEAAQADMTIYQGGEVWAQESSTARVGIEEVDALLRVAPNTIFTLERPDEDLLHLSLDEGQMWVNVEGLDEGQVLEVETPTAIASVRGTQFGVGLAYDGSTLFSTRAGTVTVSAASQTVTVTTGFETRVVSGQAPTDPVTMTAEAQVGWGMATGDDLAIGLPVTGQMDVLTHTGSVNYMDASADGQHYLIGYYDFDSSQNFNQFYDLQSQTPFSVTLPENAVYAQFNPAGDGIGYLEVSYSCSLDEGGPNFECDQLCSMGLDGSDLSCVNISTMSSQFSWSPDGEWYLYYPMMDYVSYDIYRVRTDGSDRQALTAYDSGECGNATWSPDSSMIAYTHFETYDQPGTIWTMNADGSNAQQLFDQARPYGDIAWSPDGANLAVPGYTNYDTGDGPGGIWILPVDGSAPWVITGTETWPCYDVTWSPTEEGWPVCFYGYAEYGQAGTWWTMPGWDAPQYFADVYWGPMWSIGDDPWVAFGYGGHYSDPGQYNQALFFSLEPSWWEE